MSKSKGLGRSSPPKGWPAPNSQGFYRFRFRLRPTPNAERRCAHAAQRLLQLIAHKRAADRALRCVPVPARAARVATISRRLRLGRRDRIRLPRGSQFLPIGQAGQHVMDGAGPYAIEFGAAGQGVQDVRRPRPITPGHIKSDGPRIPRLVAVECRQTRRADAWPHFV